MAKSRKPKEVLTVALAQRLKESLAPFIGTVMGPETVPELTRAVTKALFETAIHDGRVVLPDGWGEIALKKRVTSIVTAPDGRAVEVGPKPRLTYITGKAAKAVLGQTQ